MSRSVSVFCSQYGGTVGATFCLRDQLFPHVFPAKPFFAQRKVAADISISRSSVVHEADDGGLGGPMMEEDGCDSNNAPSAVLINVHLSKLIIRINER